MYYICFMIQFVCVVIHELHFYAADERRTEFAKLNSMCLSSTFHTVKRCDVFNSVNELLSKRSVLLDFPLRIKFDGELGFDSGGVCRDMFSAYWEEAFKKFFEGSSVLTPAIHAGIDMLSLPRLGLVLSHGYIVSGFLPTRVVFPSLARMLLGSSTEVPEHILLEAFADGLSSYEHSTLKEALSVTGGQFSQHLLSKLVYILSRYGCRVSPTPATLKSQLVTIANFEFGIKPLAAIHAISSGIPPEQKVFWNSLSVQQIYTIYVAISGTAEKVLEILEEPMFENDCEARVFNYLQQFIGDMKRDEIRRFLRFTTGSSVLLGSKISVCFNTESGLARRPTAHTCSCILDLPSTYLNYLDFEQEFKCILNDDEFSWEMHSI